jgi:hypothetical protein
MKKFLILTLFAGIPLLFLSCSKPEGKIPENEFIFNEIPTDSIQGYIARGFYRKALPLLIDELGIVTNDTLARLKLLLDISGV